VFLRNEGKNLTLRPIIVNDSWRKKYHRDPAEIDLRSVLSYFPPDREDQRRVLK